jgi:hypothetical protein
VTFFDQNTGKDHGMRNIFLGLCVLVLLSGCMSPAARMSQEDISSLSNQQLCGLNNSYGWEEKTQIEIGRRNLNCDPVFNECLNRGSKPNTPEMALCTNQIRQTMQLEEQVKRQQKTLESQMDKQRRELEYQRGLDNLQRMKQANQPQIQNHHQPQFCAGFPFCH